MNKQEASQVIATKLEEATAALKAAMEASEASGVPFTWQPTEAIRTGWLRVESDYDIDYGDENTVEEEAHRQLVGELGEEYNYYVTGSHKEGDWEHHKPKAEDYEERLKEYVQKLHDDGRVVAYSTPGAMTFKPEVKALEFDSYWLPSSAFC